MDIKSVVVIGAGTMGSGIAQWFAGHFVNVELVDTNPAQLEKALKGIHSSWEKLVEKEKLTSCKMNQMKPFLEVKELKDANKNADLVIEAIIENLDIKKNLFSDLDKTFSEKTILSSNTSSFPITLLSSAVSDQRKEKFIGLHFFNPATLMKLVEVIVGDKTSPALAQDLYKWFDSKDKKPALCKDSPGFIVNRVARNFYGEPLRIAEVDNTEKLAKVPSYYQPKALIQKKNTL
jgi:3-hydroxybutyryl-CoA dehydrogenase